MAGKKLHPTLYAQINGVKGLEADLVLKAEVVIQPEHSETLNSVTDHNPKGQGLIASVDKPLQETTTWDGTRNTRHACLPSGRVSVILPRAGWFFLT